MKKLILTLGIAIASYLSSFAQWSTGTDIYNTNTGNVGIGTTTPSFPLHIYRASSSSSTLQTIENAHASNNATYTNYVNPGGTLSVGMERSVGSGMIGGSGSYAGTVTTQGAYPLLFGTDGTVRMTVLPTSGNVGIGTTTPSNRFTIQGDASSSGAADGVAQLLIRGNTNIYKRLAIGMDTYNNVGFIKSDNYGTAPYPLSLQPDGGNVGIGTPTPSHALEVAGNVAITGTNGLILNTSGGGAIDNQTGNLFLQKADGAGFIFRNTSPTYTEYMRISPSGNLLIGKSSQNDPTYKLDINGKARANEIVVNTDGADFVFEPDYNLPKLSDVKKFINQNHHLPGIPSATNMQKNGVSVGELNTKLLQKIEELTLYLIDQQKINQSLQKQIDQLAKKK